MFTIPAFTMMPALSGHDLFKTVMDNAGPTVDRTLISNKILIITMGFEPTIT